MDRFLIACDNLGIAYTIYPKKGSKAVSVSLKMGKDYKYVEILKKYGILNEKSKTKRLPNIVYELTERQKMQFIGVMFSTDGYFCKKR